MDVRVIGETTERETIAIDPIRLGPSYALPSQNALVAVQANLLVSSALLGRYAFDKQVLDLDFQNKTYRVSTRDAVNANYPHAHRIWTLGVRASPTAFDISVDGVKADGIFDSGLPAAMALFPKFLKKFDIMTKAVALGPYRASSGATGKLVRMRYVKVSEIKLYDMTFRDVWVLAVLDEGVPSPGVLGLNVLVGLELIKHFGFTMDFIKRRRYLVTPTRTDPVLGEPLFRSSKWATSTFEGSLALYEKTGLESLPPECDRLEDYIRLGNPRRILAYNGFDLTGTFDPLALARTVVPGRPVTFEVESGRRSETVIVEPELVA